MRPTEAPLARPNATAETATSLLLQAVKITPQQAHKFESEFTLQVPLEWQC